MRKNGAVRCTDEKEELMKLLKKLCCPLLFSLFFVAALFFPVAFASADDTVDLKLSEGTYRYDYAYEVFKLVNEERARVHLEPLVMDAELTEAAMQRAAETHAIYSHTRPDGSGCSTICPARMRGENIAYGQDSPAEVMDAWMTSSGHRANILHSGYTNIGIGCFVQDSCLFWVQAFSYDTTTGAYVQQPNRKVSPIITVSLQNLNLVFGETEPLFFTEETKTLQMKFASKKEPGLVRLDPSNFDWSIADPTVASLDQSGVMRLKNGGATTVTVSLKSRPSIQVSIQANAFYDLSKASVTSGFHTAYTGSPITFSPTVTYNGKTLTENTHYTISFSNNVNSGKASFEIKGLGLYQSTYNGTFIINKASIQNTSIKLPYSSYAWTGKPITPVPTVTYGGLTLKEGTDYTLSWSNNTDKGTANVIITGCGNFTGTKSQSFSIQQFLISKATISTISPVTYTGQPVTPEPTVKLNGKVLQKDRDYKLTYSNNINVSKKAQVTVTGIGKYSGNATKFFEIKARKLSGETIQFPDFSYSGSSPSGYVSSNLSILYKGTKLTCGTDYTLSATKDSSTKEISSIRITFCGNYTGTRSFVFLKSYGRVTAILDQTYTGKAITPTIRVTYNSRTLTKGKDYTLTLANNVNPGTASVTITGKNGFFSSQTVTFKIVKKGTGDSSNTGNTGSNGNSNGSTGNTTISLTAPVLSVATAWNKVTLRWNRISNADSYLLYKKTNSGKYMLLKTLSKGKLVYSDTKVSVGNTYRYMIKAGKTMASGKKVYSSLSKTVSAKPALSRPLITIRRLSGKQRITWRKVSGATGYILYQRTGSGVFRKIKTLTSRSTSWSVTTKKGTSYSYKLIPYLRINGKIKTGPSSVIKTAKGR